ncbi:MAG: hypothetical protein BEN18_09785 [Epulopiscium sp. Nuni2H_MBin001]|nr:MAG: hypothetical protein BEN18_09785 [Epulopiscium sp. Nuni2H_MBin001]
MKKLDFVVIGTLLISSFVPTLLLGSAESSDITVSFDSEVVKQLQFGADGKHLVEKDGQFNVIEIEGDTIRVIDSNCVDKLCILQGAVSDAGDMIICLPHKMQIIVGR